MSASANLHAPPRRWFRIIGVSLLLFLFFLLIAGYLYENISETRDRRFNPMPGQLIDVGGYKMHIFCSGQGSPAVILDSGLGDSYVSWYKVQPEIAKVTRVCSYDRAGLGYSDPSPRARTSRVMSEELHTLLHNAGITPPLVLVGHSAGGYDVRVYTSLYRNEVAGMVLVDASHPEQQKRFPQALNDMDGSWLREIEFIEFTQSFGIPRLMGFCDFQPQVRAAECNFNTARGNVQLLKTFKENAAETAAAGSLGDMPLVVLSHDPDKPSSELPADLVKPVNDAWQQMQEELAHLSTRGTHIVAKNSGHYVQLDRPDLVVEAIRNVAQAASGGSALQP